MEYPSNGMNADKILEIAKKAKTKLWPTWRVVRLLKRMSELSSRSKIFAMLRFVNLQAAIEVEDALLKTKTKTAALTADIQSSKDKDLVNSRATFVIRSCSNFTSSIDTVNTK